MSMVAKVVSVMEKVLGPGLELLAEQQAVIQRKRKFTGQSLVRMMVLTLLKKPDAKVEDLALTAAQWGVPVSGAAVAKRFTQPLADFLRACLNWTRPPALAAEAVPVPLLERFTAVFLGDSSRIRLPDELQTEFPGWGGTGDGGLAALKIQVRRDLKTGALPQVLIEVGKASDAKSPSTHHEPLAGSVEIWDLGYFSWQRFRRLNAAQAFFLSRWQQGTRVFSEHGPRLKLREFLSQHAVHGVVDVPVQLGVTERLPCRLLAVRVPEELANRRRQKAREKARDHGREASADDLELWGWSLFVTHLTAEELTWREALVLSRARWQIELLFKLWKSHNQWAHRRPGARPAEVLAVLWAKLRGVILQHWLLLSTVWPDGRRSLWKAARMIRDWIITLIEALDHHEQFLRAVTHLKSQLSHVAKIQSRKTQPSHFQLLSNPELLTWGA